MNEFEFKGEAPEASWAERHKVEIEFLESVSTWSDFASSLLNYFRTHDELTDSQLASTRKFMKSMADKAQAVAPKRVSQRLEDTKLVRMFRIAQDSGLKRPKITVDKLVLSMAPETGRNAGSIYVKELGTYLGKITPEGSFYPASHDGMKPETFNLVAQLVNDPEQTLEVHGVKTGQCCLCARELTNHNSIARGIGPICAARWGL